MLHQETRTCGLAFAISRSCSVTSWTISFFLWTSPLGRGTYSSASRSNSVANVSQRPCLCRNTATEESFLSKSQRNDTRFLTNVNCHWTTTQPRESTGARRPSRCLTEPRASSNTESRPGDERVRGAAVNSNKSVSSSFPDRSRPAPPAHLYWLKETLDVACQRRPREVVLWEIVGEIDGVQRAAGMTEALSSAQQKCSRAFRAELRWKTVVKDRRGRATERAVDLRVWRCTEF